MVNLETVSDIDYDLVEDPFKDMAPDQADALTYWQSLSTNGNLPTWADFELVKLSPRLLATTHVVDVSLSSQEIIFRFWGTRLATIMKIEMMGRPLEHVHGSPSYIEAAAAELRSAALGDTPRVVYCAAKGPHERVIFQRTLRLPLRGKSPDLCHCVSVVDFLTDGKMATEIYENLG